MKRYKPNEWVKPFHRLGNFPLDISSLFDNTEEAMEYVHTKGSAYAGQIISIINETEKTVQVYKVVYDKNPEADNTNGFALELVGSGSSTGTGNVITVNAYSQLTNESDWISDGADSRYEGMMVYAKDTKKVYVLTDASNPNSTSSWEILGAGSGTSGGDDETLDSDLTVAGLPHDLGKYSNGSVIAAGTSAIDILKAILQKEVYPSEAQLPYITLSGTKSLGLQEVGSTVTIPAVSINYVAGKFDKSGYVSSQNTPSFSWSNPSIVVTPSVFTSITGGTVSAKSTSAYSDVVVNAGANTVTFKASASYSAPTNYPKTNLGTLVKDSSYSWVAGTASRTGSSTATGVYRLFTNGQQGSETFDGTLSYATGTDVTDATPLELINTGDTFYIKFCGQSICKWVIYVPNVYSLSDIKSYDTTSNQYNVETNFSVVGTTSKTVNGVEVTYNIYESTGKTGAQTLKITLAKA